MTIFTAPDPAQVHRLLTAASLPTDDIAGLDLQHFLGCGHPDSVQGIIGVELRGNIGLLRSLVVAPDAQSQGCGQLLVARLEQHAREHGIDTLYLLTNTAEAFFARIGYSVTQRDQVPDVVRGTREFSQLCPASATTMRKRLN